MSVFKLNDLLLAEILFSLPFSVIHVYSNEKLQRETDDKLDPTGEITTRERIMLKEKLDNVVVLISQTLMA